MAILTFNTEYGEVTLRDALIAIDDTHLDEAIEIKVEGELLGEAFGYTTSRFDEDEPNVIDEVEKFIAQHCDTLRLRL